MVIFGLLTALSALAVILSRRPLNSALWLVLTFFLVAVNYALLSAQFIATLQVLVYAGAIMVLVIFVIMLLGVDTQSSEPPQRVNSILVSICVGAFVGIMLDTVLKGGIKTLGKSAAALPEGYGGISGVGQLLFTKYLFPFEVVSVLLLAAIVGAVMLAHEKKRPLAPGRGLRAKQKQYEQSGEA